MQKGLELSQKVQADLLVATDPDCDRCGIAVNQNGEYVLMSGNEVGVLLLDFIAQARIKNGKMPKDPVAVARSSAPTWRTPWPRNTASRCAAC